MSFAVSTPRYCALALAAPGTEPSIDFCRTARTKRWSLGLPPRFSIIPRKASPLAWQATQSPTGLPVAPRVSAKSLRPRSASWAAAAAARPPNRQAASSCFLIGGWAEPSSGETRAGYPTLGVPSCRRTDEDQPGRKNRSDDDRAGARRMRQRRAGRAGAEDRTDGAEAGARV